MTASDTVRYTGRLGDLGRDDRARLLKRDAASDAGVGARTRGIIDRVRRGGDGALRALASELDGVQLGALEVPRAFWRGALRDLDPSVRRALERAADNITRVHAGFLPESVEVESEPGIVVGRRPDPLARVGVYAPGGRAAYPSSVLMGVIPARVAGVEQIIVCSPPGPNGMPSDIVLAAAELTEANCVYAVGGAGAIAAMALGTETIPRVERIVGPGNAYVAEAKLQLAGAAAFDSPAGPSEILVIADGTADPDAVAREMVAQAEHDPLACAVALVIAPASADAILEALSRSSGSATRSEVIAESLAANGAVLRADSLEEAVAFANEYAAEHLLLAVDAPDEVLPSVRNAGTVFLGQAASVAFGDYMTGANHVLPTGGRARSWSGLSTLDFIRWTTYQRVSPEAAARLAADVGTLATAEGLFAHAAAARAWGATS